MSQYLPPKARNTPLMSFYSHGETQSFPAPTRFSAHSAEPGPAATLSQRNPHFSETMEVKPYTVQRGEPAAYRPGMYANRSMGHLGEATLAQGVNSLEAMKVAKARAYAG
jgi:hypothetical protein